MKISTYQIFWMLFSMGTGMSLLLPITPAIQTAKQDAWISIVIAGGIAGLIAMISIRLSLLYPQQTLIQYSQTILGKWLGKIIVLSYFVQWYTVIGIILRQFAEFLETSIFTRTPLFVIMLFMTFLMIYASYSGGIECIGRCSEILGPIIFLMVFGVLIADLFNIDLHNIRPVYVDTGLIDISKGALPPTSFLGESSILMMLVSFTKSPKKITVFVLWAIGISDFLIMVATALILLTFGPDLPKNMWYPFFDMTRITSIFSFIENIDALVVVIWVSSVFIKLCIYFFTASYGTAQWLHIQNWKVVIWLLAPLVIVLAMLPTNVDTASMIYPKQYWLPYVLPVNMIGIPLLLWFVGSIRKRLKKESRSTV